MAKGQQKSNRETKKPKKKAEDKVASTGLAAFSNKSSGSSYKDRYAKQTTSK